MDIADFKSRTFTRQTSGTQRGQPSFMCGFRQRIGLIHELGKLACPEKFLYHRGHGFGIDKIIGHERVHFLKTHPLFDSALHPHQPDTVLIFQKLADSAYTPVSEMVNIIHDTLSVAQPYKRFGGQQNIFPSQGSDLYGGVYAQTEIEFHSAHAGQIVISCPEEHLIYKILRDFGSRGIARSEPAVNIKQCFLFGIRLVHEQSFADSVAARYFVQKQDFEFTDPRGRKFRHRLRAYALIGFCKHFPRFGMYDRIGENALTHLFRRYGNHFHACLFQLPDRALGKYSPFSDKHFAGGRISDIACRTPALLKFFSQFLEKAV